MDTGRNRFHRRHLSLRALSPTNGVDYTNGTTEYIGQGSNECEDYNFDKLKLLIDKGYISVRFKCSMGHFGFGDFSSDFYLNVMVSPTALDKLCILLKWLQMWTNTSGEILHRSRCFTVSLMQFMFEILDTDHESSLGQNCSEPLLQQLGRYCLELVGKLLQTCTCDLIPLLLLRTTPPGYERRHFRPWVAMKIGILVMSPTSHLNFVPIILVHPV
ncbi:hypothetical protein TNCV_4979171 [Trichonephila clavipes]|nr:hypothetical protein TNCV_4979171 [Trichonephila clavipes]